jgi:hypothetical protein
MQLASLLNVSKQVVYGYHTNTKQQISAAKLHTVLIALGFKKITYNLPKYQPNEY